MVKPGSFPELAVTSEMCPFCGILEEKSSAARIVYDDGEVAAFFPLEPATRGHTLVVPRRHVPYIWQLTEKEAERIAAATVKVAAAMNSSLHPEGINIVQSNGEAATQTVSHLHVHVVPRWQDDRMTLQWPDSGASSRQELDATLTVLKAALVPPIPKEISAEDRRQHLSFIQSVITRMSQASSSAKAWLLPIVTVAYGYALTENTESVALLGISATVVFGLLDANYLKQERAFRKLYDSVARGDEIPHFSMNPSLASSEGNRVNYLPTWGDIFSWAITPVYAPLILVGVIIFSVIGF